MFFALMVWVVTGVVGRDTLGLGDTLDDGWIGGNPVSFAFEHAEPASASAHSIASKVNERRIDFSPSARGDAARSEPVSSNHQKRAQIGLAADTCPRAPAYGW
jgi:hypothetical protein